MKTNPLSVKKWMKKLILRTLRQFTWCLKSSFLYGGLCHQPKLKIFILSFSSILKFLSCSNSSAFQNIYCFRHFSSSCYFFKLLFLLSECDQTLHPLCFLNPIYSQILHMRFVWNSFKFFTVSLTAEEIEQVRNFKTEEKLKLKIFNFWWWRNPQYKNADFRHCVQLW